MGLTVGNLELYMGPATRLNDENIIIIGDLAENDATARDKQQRLGQFALSEIERIIRDHGEPFQSQPQLPKFKTETASGIKTLAPIRCSLLV